MKNWIKGLLIAVVAIGFGLGQVDASSRFEQHQPVVMQSAVTSEIGISDSFVQRSSSGGFSGGSSSRSSSGGFSSGSSFRSSGGFSGSSSSRSSSGSFGSKPSSSWGSKPSTPSPSRSSSSSFGSKPSTPSRSSSGGFGSSSSKPSSSASSAPSKPSSGWFSGSSSKSSSVKQNVVVQQNKTVSSVDNKISSGTKSSGKSFSSKQSAVAAFKADNAKETSKGGKYTAHYDKEPTARPSHIPATTTVGNSNVNVTYNSQYGGYGYMHPTLGTWMMYDMLSDAAMISAMSHNHGYYNGGGGYGGNTTVYHSSGGMSFITFGLLIFVVVVVAVVILAAATGVKKK